MKLKTLLVYTLSVVVILSVLTGCAIQNNKKSSLSKASRTNNATSAASLKSTTLSSGTHAKTGEIKSKVSSVHYPIGVGYIWNYDITIKSYYSGKQISETTYSVETNPQKEEIHLPGKLFQDGSSRILTINKDGQTTLYNPTTKSYEVLPQGIQSQNFFQKTLQSFQTLSPSSQGFAFKKMVDNKNALYVKNKGNLKYEMIANPQNNVAKRISVYQNGNLIANETIETEQRDGIYLPKEITVTQKAINIGKSNTQIVSYVNYNTTEFKKIQIKPTPSSKGGKGK